MKKFLSLAALLLLAFAGSAQAATIEVILGNTSVDKTYGVGGSIPTPNIDLSTYGGLVLTNSVIVNPASSLAGQYAQPTGPIYQNNYLSVFGGGNTIFTLAPNQSSFGFTWGTIDTYNALLLTDSRGVVYTITGAEVLSNIVGSINGTTQTDINFLSPLARIISAQLISTQNSFEAANFSQLVGSAVPLPAALPLFGMGLLGLAALRRRQAAKA
ncbi:MAG: VPLPA-CTERM sorting domain-containing protein [Alphaproteobacteria bacterium]